MRTGIDEGDLVDGFVRELRVDILRGTERLERDVPVSQWSLSSNLGRDPKTTGSLTFVHDSVKGESWVPVGTRGLLSPFQATLLLTEVVRVGEFERRVQLGFFDVVAVPFAEDFYAQVGSRDADAGLAPDDDVIPDDDLFPELTVAGSRGRQMVAGSTVRVDVESLDGRVLAASFRAPRTAVSSARDEWQAIGLLPVAVSGDDAVLPATTWACEQGSRLDAVQQCARLLGGVPVVNYAGLWSLVTDGMPAVTLTLGERGTITELQSELSTDGFFNVVVGDYETEKGRPLRSVWVAPGHLSPESMGREFVRYHASDLVRSQAAADEAVASVGWLHTSQEVDVRVTCVYNPLVEVGDPVVVPGVLSGVAQEVTISDAETMQLLVRTRRSL